MRNACLFLILCLCLALAYPAVAGGHPDPSNRSELTPFLLGGIQTHELDHQRWMAALHQAGMNAVQVTAYAHQGAWNTSKLWYHEDEPAVLNEIRTARQNGLQVVLILRVALDHNEPENRFLWHGLIYPESVEATAEWFSIYTDFVLKWARIAEREGVEVLGIASEMNSLAATLPVDEMPGLSEYYLNDESQLRLRRLVGRSEHLFTEQARRSMGAGDFTALDDFLVQRNRAERAWARTYTFAGDEDRLAAINRRRELLEGHWRELAKKARRAFSGRLTLAANFDNYHEVSFWDALDFIGINAYFPLRRTLETPLSEEGLAESWRGIFGDVDTFRKTHELTQPVVLTELGYTRRKGVTVAPWSSQGFIPMWDPDGETDKDRAFFWSSQPFDPSERALAMRALHRVYREGRADLAGVLYWKLSSRRELERYEPFLLYLGQSSGDPLLGALTRFAEGIRPFAPPQDADLYRRAAHAIVRDDLEALVALGTDALAPTPAGQPPLLHLAVRLGRGSLVRHLLLLDADHGDGGFAGVESSDSAGFLPIHWTCYQDDPALVDLLRPKAAAPWRDALGETPLMKCARLDNAAVAESLLSLGEKATSRNELGQSPLHLAADQGSAGLVAMLLARGGDADAADEQGSTPLHVAARRGETEIVRLLAEGSTGRPDRRGHRPIHEAAFYGKPEVFELLFDPDLAGELNEDRQSLLHLAAYGGHLDILKTLISHFPDVDRPVDHNGWTPLLYAVEGQWPEAVALLLEHGASARHRSEDGTTPLLRGSGRRDSRVIEHLLRHGVAVDLADADGNTALHHAAGWGWLENIRLLLEAGADASLRNRAGDTALDTARDSGRRRAVELLRAAAPGPTREVNAPAGRSPDLR